MKYLVSIGYNEFCFDNGMDAMDFAKSAARHMVKPKDKFSNTDVIITVENDSDNDSDKSDKEEENNNGMDV